MFIDDEQLHDQLTALASHADGLSLNPASLLRRHAVLRRRRTAAYSGAALAVSSVGVVLVATSPGVENGNGRDTVNGTQAAPSIAAATCPAATEPFPSPRPSALPAETASESPGPQPSASPLATSGADVASVDAIPPVLAAALDASAPNNVHRACDLGNELLYAVDGSSALVAVSGIEPGAELSADRAAMAAKTAGATLTTLDSGALLRSTDDSKLIETEVATDRYVATFTMERSRADLPLTIDDLNAWAARLAADTKQP